MPREVTKNNTKKTFCSFPPSVYHPPQKPKFSLHTLWPNANKEKNMTCLFINFLRSWCSFFIMCTFLHFHNWSVFSTLRTIQTDFECNLDIKRNSRFISVDERKPHWKILNFGRDIFKIILSLENRCFSTPFTKEIPFVARHKNIGILETV